MVGSGQILVADVLGGLRELPERRRVAADGRINRRYCDAKSHTLLPVSDIDYDPVAARKRAQITTILAMTSPANGSTAARIAAAVVGSIGGA